MRSKKYTKSEVYNSGTAFSGHRRRGFFGFYAGMTIFKKIVFWISIVLILTTAVASAKSTLDINRVKALISERAKLDNTDYIDKGCSDIVLIYTGMTNAKKAESSDVDNVTLLHFGGKTQEGDTCTNIVTMPRDTYIRRGNSDYYGSLAGTYKKSSGKMLMTTISKSADLNVKYYASFDNETIIKLVDLFNSLVVNVKKGDIYQLNKEQKRLIKEYGGEYVPVSAEGVQVLNGLQTAAFCEIGTGSARENHLGAVIKRLVSGLKHSSPADLEKARSIIISGGRNNIDDNYCIKAGARIQKYASGERGKWNKNYERLTYNGSRYVFMTTLVKNDKYMHKELFLEKSYKPSSEVKTQSSYITKMIKKIEAAIAAAKKKAAKEAAAKKKAEEEKKAQEEQNKNNTNSNTDNNNSNNNNNKGDDSGNIDNGGGGKNSGGGSSGGGSSDDGGDYNDF